VYRNTLTLQVTDTIRSYELNFHPVPLGVTASCEHYITGLPVCYGGPSDVFAARRGFVQLYTLRFKEKEKRVDGGDMSRCTYRPAQAMRVTSRGSKFVTGVQAMSLQLAAASYIYKHYALKKKSNARTAVTCHVARPHLLRP
jgi:hypothetical protein